MTDHPTTRFTRPTIRRLARQFVAEIISKEPHRP